MCFTVYVCARECVTHCPEMLQDTEVGLVIVAVYGNLFKRSGNKKKHLK